MLKRLAHWWQRSIIKRSRVTAPQWELAFASLPLLTRLSPSEKETLRELAIIFLHRKSIEGAGDFAITLQMMLVIALQACLPILKLGIDWYAGWISVIVYPKDFIPVREVLDDAGVLHTTRNRMSGESWQRGPVILSWVDTQYAGVVDGHNLVIHEFAHKLDMANGVANGFPPLHQDMDIRQWTKTFTHAYNDFCFLLQHGIALPFDAYAAESPAEFFAVLSEVFFEKPENIAARYPEVYEQLSLFYKQDPVADFNKLRER